MVILTLSQCLRESSRPFVEDIFPASACSLASDAEREKKGQEEEGQEEGQEEEEQEDVLP